MIEYNKTFEDNSILPFFLKPQNDSAPGQVQFCYNLTVNLYEKGNSPCNHEFSEVRKKRQILDHSIKDICSITSYNGIFTIEIVSPKPNLIAHRIQTDDIDIDYIKIYNNKIQKEQS